MLSIVLVVLLPCKHVTAHFSLWLQYFVVYARAFYPFFDSMGSLVFADFPYGSCTGSRHFLSQYSVFCLVLHIFVWWLS